MAKKKSFKYAVRGSKAKRAAQGFLIESGLALLDAWVNKKDAQTATVSALTRGASGAFAQTRRRVRDRERASEAARQFADAATPAVNATVTAVRRARQQSAPRPVVIISGPARRLPG